MKQRLMQFLFGGPGTATPLGDAGLLLTRIVFGPYIAIAHGWGKIFGKEGFGVSEQLVEGVGALGFPAPTFFAWCAALTELLGGLLIALGLLTRPAALLLSFNMLMAAFGVHLRDPWYGQPRSKEMAMLFLAPFVLLLFTGAGRFAIDRYLRKSR